MLSVFVQYKLQLGELKNKFTSHVQTDLKKTLNKSIYEIEGSLISLTSFYQASDKFTTSTFEYFANDLIKNYPAVENIVYAQVVYDSDKKQFYQDMYDNGLFKY